MIPLLFLNPAFLVIGAALISVPIIIHLINRMRFKRIRWAAMEFLLKAQKRTRRRLIIEQLLLLALRCLLIFFLLLLVSRFIGCGDENAAGKPNLHIVLLDDSLSMQDQVKGPDGVAKSAMEVAKQEFLIKKIAKGLAQSKTNDELMVVQLSRLREPDYKPRVYQSLHDTQKMKDFVQEINEIEATALHASILDGIKLAKRLVGEKAESRVTLHLLSDYRFIEWGGKAGEAAYKDLVEMVKENNEVRIRTIDAVYPARGAGYPPSNDNVGIVSFRPDTRVVGHKTVVHFTVTIANFSSKQVDVQLTVRNEHTGKNEFQINFNVQTERKDKTRITLSPSGLTDVTFDYGDLKNGLFFPDAPKPGEARYAHLSVRLTDTQMNPLQGDGLLLDNVRHTVVEVRDKVPILVIDGAPERDPAKAEGKDTFILERALGSITGASYLVEFPKTTDPLKALEMPDLNKYPTIFMANVRQLNPRQLANLENFVKDGGGVAFYMGANVDPVWYNKNLYKGGAGIFPAPLQLFPFPKMDEKELPEKEGGDTEQLLIREDKFGKMDRVPIFKNIFDEPRQRIALLHLPIRRYFKVNRAQWKQEPDKVFELATLPNESAASAFDTRVAEITETGQHANAVRADKRFAKYRGQLEAHFKAINAVARRDAPGDLKAYHLAGKIDALLKDRGNQNAVPPIPDLTELWDNSDTSVQSLKTELKNLSEDVKYGDPFIISRKFGKGNVIAVMSTVGKDWNDWCGGCLGSVIFQPFVWEMQKELSSPASDDNLLVGANLDLALDAEQFKGANLKLVRHFMKPGGEGNPPVPEKETKEFGRPDEGKIFFTMSKHNEPGRYEYELFDENQPGKTLAKFSQAYNVDTQREGQLARVGSDELNRELIDKANEITNNKDTARPVAPGTPDDVLVAKQNDFSESPWLFLILLLVLVTEQALAVHLSFHLKNAEDLPPMGVRA